jgi:hypothetical protein
MSIKYSHSKQDGDGELAGLLVIIAVVMVSLIAGILIGLNVA